MAEKYFLGIDIGTFESKGVITNERAEIIAFDKAPHLMESPKSGYAEHDAENTWWKDFCYLSNSLIEKSGIDPQCIAAVGCSTIAPCCLPVDKGLNPLRKAILYGVDVRAVDEIDYINNLYGQEHIMQKYGTPITSQSAGAKVLWIKNKEPEIYKETAKFVTGSTYLVAKLTGNYVIDNYTAATWVPMYNVDKCDWEEDISLFCTRDMLPDCKWSHEQVGTVTQSAAKETGIAAGTPVITGTADASAEAVSVGVFDPGDMMLMFGSSIFIIHVVDKFTKDHRLWAGPYLFPGTYSVAAGMSTSGTLTRWFRDNFAKELLAEQETGGINAYDALIDQVSNVAPGSGGLIVLPYFSGERTPINDPLAKGMIFGLNLTHKREHIYNACLEGVGYGIAQHFEIFDQKNMGTKKVMAVGGGTKSPKWLQIVSDISGKEMYTAEVEAGAAYGNTLLAALGVGHYRDLKEVASIIKKKNIFTPSDENHKTYAPYLKNYRRLYEATKDIMHDDN